MTETLALLESNFAKARARGLLHLGEIIIDGDIDPNGSIHAATIRAAINKLPPDEPIVLRFKKAAGGSFEESIRINVLLRDSGRKVIAHVEQAASAATVVACAASEVTLVEGGEYMVHSPFVKPSGFAGYRSIGVSDLQLAIDQLIEANELILDIYSARTGADRKMIAALMRMTTFLKPEDALRYGFVDKIVPALPKPEPTEDACTCADCPCHGKADLVK